MYAAKKRSPNSNGKRGKRKKKRGGGWEVPSDAAKGTKVQGRLEKRRMFHRREERE